MQLYGLLMQNVLQASSSNQKKMA